MKYKQLLARRAALIAALRECSAKADADGREMNEQEAAKYAELQAEANVVNAAIKREEELMELERQAIGQAAIGESAPHLIATPAVDPIQPAVYTNRWKSFGDFRVAVGMSTIAGRKE